MSSDVIPLTNIGVIKGRDMNCSGVASAVGCWL